jgi:hypothetical protein
MTDFNLRNLERAAASGDPDATARLNRARKRAGIRVKIIHFVPDNHHNRVHRDGHIMPRSGGSSFYRQRVTSLCSVELYPRSKAHGGVYRKHCYFTIRPASVTCKRCLSALRREEKRRAAVVHYSRRTIEGERVALCGRDFTTLSADRLKLTCQACLRIFFRRRGNNARGRRAARRMASV